MLQILDNHPGETFSAPRSYHCPPSQVDSSSSVPLDSIADNKIPSDDKKTPMKSSPPMFTSSGSKVNFAPGTSFGGETSAFGVSPSSSFYMAATGQYRGSTESKAGSINTGNGNSISTPVDDIYYSLRRELPFELSANEAALMERVFPFIYNCSVSVKTIGEIVWILRVSEEELIQVISKIPFLHIVKKPST